jgi:ribonuclease HI
MNNRMEILAAIVALDSLKRHQAADALGLAACKQKVR